MPLLALGLALAPALAAVPSTTDASLPAPVSEPTDAPSRFRFVHLSVKDGLSHSDVRSIVQDAQGFMWFGTMQGGLNRYDGVEFKVYRNAPGQAGGLGDNFVASLYSDRDGELWVGCMHSGLHRYERAADRFVSLPIDTPATAGSVLHAAGFAFEEGSGAVWRMTSEGFSRLDPATGQSRMFRYDSALFPGIADGLPTHVIQDRETSRIWIGTSTVGAMVLDPSTGGLVRHGHNPSDPASLSSNYVNQIVQDRAGDLWIATREGLNRFVRSTGKFVRFAHEPGRPDSLCNDFVDAIHEDRTGRFWVGTMKGLDLLDRRTGRFTHFRPNPSDPHSLSHEWVWRIYEDRTGNLWMATLGGGVNLLPSEPPKFVTHRHAPDDPRSLADNSVQALHVDATGRIWIGTTLGSIHSFDGRTIVRHPEDPADPAHKSVGNVLALTTTADGALWIGTFSTGLFRFDGRHYLNFRHNPADPGSLASNDVNSLLPDGRGGLWLGLHYGGGMDHLADGRFTHVQGGALGGVPGTIPVACPYLMFRDTDGRIWMGSDDRGIVRFDPRSGGATAFLVSLDGAETQANTQLFSIHPAPDGVHWVGGISGLYRFDTAQGRFTRRYTTRDGLPSDAVMAINGDDRGRLWLSTLAGISRFDPQTGEFRNYDTADGMAGAQFNRWVTAKGRDGRIYFGSEEGLVEFHPDRMRDNPHVPSVVLTGFELFNRPMETGEPGSPLKTALPVADKIVLTHRQSVFTLKFAALSFVAPEKNRYVYKMDGFDDDWRPADARRHFATYTSLPPGRYVFRVRGSNNDGRWSETDATVGLVILPPWWATWWFRGAVGFGAVGLAATAYRRRIRNLKRRSRELESVVTQRTASLSERTRELAHTNAELAAARDRAETASRAKSEFLSSMSHELRTPLNAILGYTQLLERQRNLTEKQRQQLGVMRSSGDHLLALINDVLDLGRIEAQKMQLESTVFDLRRTLDQVVRLTQVKAHEKSLSLEFEEDSRLPAFVTGDERKLRQVLINLLSNAVKYTHHGGVTLRAAHDARSGGRLRCEVRDTGIGIAPGKQAAIFEPFARLNPGDRAIEGTGLGLSITRRLVAMMGGEIGLQSVPLEGSTFWFEVPLPEAAADEFTGRKPLDPIVGYLGARRRVLVLDDNVVNIGVLVALLEPLGFVLATADSGADALQQALQNPPDILLLDMVMSGMNGVEVAREVRRHPQLDRVRILGISATVTDSERKRIFEAECDAFLRKPVEVDLLLDKLGTLLGIEWESARPGGARAAAKDEAGEPPTELPSLEILDRLRAAMRRGDFLALEQIVAVCEETGTASAAFCRHIRRLAARYDEDGIAAFLVGNGGPGSGGPPSDPSPPPQPAAH